ncbi:MAG TPA: metallophosphoesterase [Kofleriaceae bacterium]|nr:metallophosphoesterase [Kofleriaceae bacterium]
MFVRVAAAIGLAGLAACGNVTGHIGTTKVGDTSHAAERRSPVEELRTACVDGATTTYGSAALQRQPYLQQVTLTSAKLGWVSKNRDERVTITTPAGGIVGELSGVVEKAASRGDGELQIWSSATDLQPGTVYCYQLSDSTRTLNQRSGFRTAPSADSDQPVRFLAFGDSGGGGADQYALADQMYTVPYDLIIHTGDLAYDDGTIGQYEDNVFGVYGDLFRNIPFFPSAGNHDYKTMKGAPFREVFNLPGDNGEKWYSYDYGRVHFVALDTESDYTTQMKWLEHDLAATKLPWKIIYMHRPPFSSGAHGSDTRLRNKLAPVLERHGVQLVLAGHDHDYERMKPQNGVAYVVTGGGGVGTKSVGQSRFTAFSEDVIHFVYVEVGVDELTLHAIDATGREFDSMTVPRVPS